MNLLNESQIFETWAPMIEEKTGITESAKLKWMTKYAHYHSLNEGFSYPQAGLLNTPGMGNVAAGNVAGGAGVFNSAGAKGSGDKFPSLLPLAIQVAARTIGFDIVSVVPMNGPAGVLTYLDYVYAGGRDPLTTPPGTAIGSKNEKALLFKIQKNGLGNTAGERAANYATVTATVAGTKYVFASAAAALAPSLLVSYVGKSRIDGALIFKVEGESVLATAGVGVFTVWPGVQAVSLADAIDGSADLYTATVTPGTNTVTAAVIVGATGDIEGGAELVKGLEDHIAGFTGAGPNDDQPYFGNATNGLTSYEPMRRGVGETSYYRTMGLQAFTKFVEAETFQVAAQVTTEQIQDLNRQYGIDVVSMVENQLVNEVSQSINKHILSRAFALGWQNHVNFFNVEGKDLNLDLDVSGPAVAYGAANAFIGQAATNVQFAIGNIPKATIYGTTGFENLGTIQRRIQSRILAAGNVVAQRGRRGPANFVVTNLQIATALQDSAQFTFYPMANTVNQNNGALYPLGTIAGMTIYVDPNMDFGDTRALIGRKGADEEPGLKFMPYLMAESIQTIAEGTMSPKIAIKSRYALAEAGFHPESQYITLLFATGATSII